MVSADNANEQLVVKWFENLSAGNFDVLKSMLHADATWKVQVRGIQGSGAHKGPAGIIDEFLKPVRLGLFKEGDPKLPIDNVLSKGSLVCVECRGEGQMKNGTEYRNLYCWLVEVKDGKIFEVREYMDSYYVSTLSNPQKS
jgi:ketosteroid isomerase-like protein